MDGMSAIREVLYGPEPTQGIMESGLDSIRESLYGSSHGPEPSLVDLGMSEIRYTLGM